MRDKPTIQELEEAENYAMSKLCTEIPNTVGSGLTRWDSSRKVCEITTKGCDPFLRNNLISMTKYDPNTGEPDYKPRLIGKNRKDFVKFWNPDFLVMKSTKNSRTPVCSRGNFMLQQWCNFPKTRGGGKTQKGVTNTEPFEYRIRAGKETCDIPKTYCDDKGVSYSRSKGECFVSGNQKVQEFFASPVLVRNSKRKSDIRLKYDIIPIKKNWLGDGIHFYSYKWKPIAKQLYGLSGEDAGVIADDLPNDHVYIDKHGYKTLKLELDTPLMNNIRNFMMLQEEFEKI